MYDVIIVGAGPAGLNAALVLGRSRRSVLLCDNGKPRNRRAISMHGYLTRDGMNPKEFLNIGCGEIARYGVEKRSMEIIYAGRLNNHFEVQNSDGEKYFGRKILLATGVKDNLPEIDGIEDFYGVSVHHCPYCDGWEERDKKIAVYAKGKAAYALSLSLKTWSDNIILCTDGYSRLSSEGKIKLSAAGIPVYYNKIIRLGGSEGRLKTIEFDNGQSVECDSLFFSTGHSQRSPIAEQLGCKFASNHHIITNKKMQTNIPGVFAAGDMVKDMSFVIVAAAEGTKAAVAINMELQEEEKKLITAE